MPRVVISFRRFGPYHHARLNAAGELGEVVGLEFSRVDKTNAWDAVSGGEHFRRDTLFDDADVDDVPASEVTRKIFAKLNAIRPDAVVIPGWAHKGALAQLQWCLDNQVPSVLFSESQKIDEPRVWWREKIKARLVGLYSAALVAGSPHVDYLTSMGFSAEKIFTGSDIIDNDHFSEGADAARQNEAQRRSEYNLPNDYFLATGRFIPKKNFDRLFEAYAKYRESAIGEPWKLVLLGDGEESDRLHAKARELSLGENLLFVGYKQYDELPTYYGLANAFILPSTTEQWGLVANEAMSAGLPIIVSQRCGCSADLVEPGVNGYTIDPYDVEELSERMVQIASDQCDRVAMARAGREIIDRWGPATYGRQMWKAVDAATQATRPRQSSIDRFLVSRIINR